jgi:hypothetical protein
MLWDGWHAGETAEKFTSSTAPCEQRQTKGCGLTIFARMLTSSPGDVKEMSNFLR